MIDVSLCHHDDVLANVILVMVLFDHLPVDCLHIGNIAQDGQADLLVAEDAPMGNLDSGLKRLGLPGFEQLSVDGAPLVLHILLTVEGVGEHIAHNLNGPLDVLPEDSHHIRGVLSRCVRVEIAADILDL